MNKITNQIKKFFGRNRSNDFIPIPIKNASELYLWPDNIPGAHTENEKIKITPDNLHVITNVHHPSITVYLPANGTETGTAIILAPGGSHEELWVDHEGHYPAEWFQKRGIAAFVLKYRLANQPHSAYTIEQHALADIQRAIRIVRCRAEEWKIDSNRIGVMGFSAGGELAGLAAMHHDKGSKSSADIINRQSSYPDFQALIYPGGAHNFKAEKNSPPLFLLGGFHDYPEIVEGMLNMYRQYKHAGVPAEIHLYANAEHGFGLRHNNQGTAVATWLDRFEDWLSDTGLLRKKPDTNKSKVENNY